MDDEGPTSERGSERPTRIENFRVNLCRVFSEPGMPVDPEKRLETHIARLIVLLEDLRIEVHGMQESTSYSDLEQVSARYRRLYFLRRSTLTAREILEAVRLLEGSQRFTKFSATFTEDYKLQWRASAKALERDQKRILKLRNAVGGHFSFEASANAVDGLDAEVDGTFRVVSDQNGATMNFIFAETLAAGALLSNSEPEATLDGRVADLANIVKAALKHASDCIYLAAYHLLFNYADNKPVVVDADPGGGGAKAQ